MPERITVEDKRRSAERELGMRRRVYPRWVEIKKMTQAMSDREIAIMEAIVDDYRALEAKERLI